MVSCGPEEIESLLLCGQRLADDEIALLKCSLKLMKADYLRSVSKCLGAQLTGAMQKGDIIERLLEMAQIGTINDTSNDGTMDGTTPVTISYLTGEVKRVLSSLPPFSIVTQWIKALKGILKDFS